jgi:hypothetical protein
MADRLLSRVNSLDRLFATPPGDVAEQRRRDRVIEYDVTHLRFAPGADTLLVISNVSKGNYGCSAGNLSCRDSTIISKAMKMCSSFLKIYKMQFSLIRFVHGGEFF